MNYFVISYDLQQPGQDYPRLRNQLYDCPHSFT